MNKPRRIVDKDAIAAARRDHCEWCGKPTFDVSHVHHHKSRGAGGDDVAENLVSLCWFCHDLVHRARISRAEMADFIHARGSLHLDDGVAFCRKTCGVRVRPKWNGETFICPQCGDPME